MDIGFQPPGYKMEFKYKMDSASKLDILQNGISKKNIL